MFLTYEETLAGFGGAASRPGGEWEGMKGKGRESKGREEEEGESRAGEWKGP